MTRKRFTLIITQDSETPAAQDNRRSPSTGTILRTVVDAMLDSLTPEQQTKMASFLQRSARQQSEARRRAQIRGGSASAVARAC